MSTIDERIDAYQAERGLPPVPRVQGDGAARYAAMCAPRVAEEPITLTNLTDAQREAVVGIAGNDPAKQEATLKALAPTWNRFTADDPRAVYAEINKTNPVIAARYALRVGLFDR